MRYQSFGCAFVLLMRGSGENREVLLHLRQNTGYRDGQYDVSASGHLEPGESFEQCAIRETMEEVGVLLKPEDIKFCLLNHHVGENYVRTFFSAELPAGATPQVCEPDKSGGLLWANIHNLPANVEPFIPKVLDCIKYGIYYDDGDFTKLAMKIDQINSGKLREIHKKLSPEYFEKILSGEKTFEYRVNDFECRPGDILVLDEYEYDLGQATTAGRHPTGRSIRKKVGHVAHTADFDWLKRPDVKANLEKYGDQIISLLDE